MLPAHKKTATCMYTHIFQVCQVLFKLIKEEGSSRTQVFIFENKETQRCSFDTANEKINFDRKSYQAITRNICIYTHSAEKYTYTHQQCFHWSTKVKAKQLSRTWSRLQAQPFLSILPVAIDLTFVGRWMHWACCIKCTCHSPIETWWLIAKKPLLKLFLPHLYSFKLQTLPNPKPLFSLGSHLWNCILHPIESSQWYSPNFNLVKHPTYSHLLLQIKRGFPYGQLACRITRLTGVFGRQRELLHRDYKPINVTGGAPPCTNHQSISAFPCCSVYDYPLYVSYIFPDYNHDFLHVFRHLFRLIFPSPDRSRSRHPCSQRDVMLVRIPTLDMRSTFLIRTMHGQQILYITS